jgi:Phosphotransferase enzyme family
MTAAVFEGRLTRESVRTVLERACLHVGLEAAGATLIRMVNNAVFRLAAHPVVVRIVLTSELSHRAENAAAAARLFAANNVPSVALLDDVPGPVDVGGYSVSFWHAVVDTKNAPTAADLARLLTQVHRIPCSETGLARWNPIADLHARITGANYFDRDAVDFLRRRCDAVEVRLDSLRCVLPPSVIHGDAHLRNLITTPAGTVLCDLDTVCIGPREWDLVPIAVGQVRFRPKTNTQRQLVDAYGFDVTQWDGFPVLRELRELKLAAVGLQAAAGNSARGSELRRRLHTIRTGDTLARWTPYR